LKLAIAEAIKRLEPQGRLTKIVAIDGYGGSGKSELADRLARELGVTTVVRTDDFARPNVVGWEWDRLRAHSYVPTSSAVVRTCPAIACSKSTFPAPEGSSSSWSRA